MSIQGVPTLLRLPSRSFGIVKEHLNIFVQSLILLFYISLTLCHNVKLVLDVTHYTLLVWERALTRREAALQMQSFRDAEPHLVIPPKNK